MESLYPIHLTPESLLEPNPIGYVRAQDVDEARRRAARPIRIGLHLTTTDPAAVAAVNGIALRKVIAPITKDV